MSDQPPKLSDAEMILDFARSAGIPVPVSPSADRGAVHAEPERWFVEETPSPIAGVGYTAVAGPMLKVDADRIAYAKKRLRPAATIQVWQHPQDVEAALGAGRAAPERIEFAERDAIPSERDSLSVHAVNEADDESHSGTAYDGDNRVVGTSTPSSRSATVSAALGAGETPQPPTERLVIAQPYCDGNTCWSNYHSIVGDKCEWCQRPLSILTIEAEYTKRSGVAAPPAVPAPQLEKEVAEAVEWWDTELRVARARHSEVEQRIMETSLRVLQAAVPAPPDVQALIAKWRSEAEARKTIEGWRDSTAPPTPALTASAHHLRRCADELESALAASSGSRPA